MRLVLRPARVWAVALRDLRQRTGKHWYRLPATALVLLVPAGVIGFELSSPHVATVTSNSGITLPVVGGNVPTILADQLQRGDGSDVSLSGGEPLVVTGLRVPRQIRKVLNTLPGADAVAVRRYRPPIRLPGRSLLLALLAISLLTGPLAETLPGERARNTLEVLLSAGISRAELVGGKWLAWTLAASSTALLAAAATVVSGVQEAGVWILGLPLFIASGVAFGLWLVRGVADIVGGAAAPMRVLPIVSMGMAGAAYGVASIHPLAGAAVPLGGPLLVAGGVFVGPSCVAMATFASAGWISLALAATARGLDRSGDSGGTPAPSVIGVVVAAAAAWWLPVAGPGVWTLAGNPGAAGSVTVSILAGGLALIAVASITNARAIVTEKSVPVPDLFLYFRRIGVGVGVGVVAWLVLRVLPSADLGLIPDAFAHRLAVGTAPSAAAGVFPALVAAAGQSAVFFGVVAARSGAVVACCAWVLVISIAAPLHGIATGLAAALAWSRAGTLAAGACLAVVAVLA
ncbi:MAG: hypothetical protein ACI8TX_002071 [Hyphomicrobiaceae bacterium]